MTERGALQFLKIGKIISSLGFVLKFTADRL